MVHGHFISEWAGGGLCCGKAFVQGGNVPD